ncbi:SURF1 family cytochrome oxidase biogenesis protein [Rhodococcus sp. AG1013]|uniref:SURF1 family cytochrome oxidase biogenesis protein n=1 Tax=unclassified Rhodococcus (in: high G+C Gram-positive bacteria) TaxID=192944 RepID=UPI000E0A6208|nr:SURF1 family protein [Rhodococcus sp. AG1013]RDI32500.1 cytochrome oxidase assembly protein ShyY1 [Rhodococcus sp. AG1013]
MRRLKFLLRPGWLALAAVVAGFAFMCFTVLAPWQLGKNTRTEERNGLLEQSINADAVSIDTLLGGAGPAPDDEWRKVVATGTYLPDSDLLVRLRSVEDAPAYEVLTPMRLSDGATLLVNRGYVRPVQGTEAPPIPAPPTGEVSVEGRFRMSEGTVPGKEPITEAGTEQVYYIDSGQIGQFIGTDLVNGYLQLDDAQPGGLGTIPLPMLDAGPYLSYGLQWLAFGIMAPLGLAYFVRAELRERRKTKATAAAPPAPEPADEPTTATPPVDETPAGAAPEPTVDEFALPTRRRGLRKKDAAPSAPLSASEAKMADRYGRRR